MLFYFKTKIPVRILYPFLKRYIDISSYHYTNLLLDNYLKTNYNISLYNILQDIKNNVKISNINDSLIQVYFDKNKMINGNKLEYIISFLEYGNLDVKSPKLISRIITNSLIMLDNEIGGY